MINKWKFFIHRVHVNFEREAYREKEGERSSEFTWNLWTKNFHLLIKFYKTWMKKYGHFFETLPSCIFWIKINTFEIIAIFHHTVGDEPGITFGHVPSCSLCFVDKVSRCKYQSKTLAAVGLEPSIFQFRGENHSTRLQWLVYLRCVFWWIKT